MRARMRKALLVATEQVSKKTIMACIAKSSIEAVTCPHLQRTVAMGRIAMAIETSLLCLYTQTGSVTITSEQMAKTPMTMTTKSCRMQIRRVSRRQRNMIQALSGAMDSGSMSWMSSIFCLCSVTQQPRGGRLRERQ